jgi:hypothetical protein
VRLRTPEEPALEHEGPAERSLHGLRVHGLHARADVPLRPRQEGARATPPRALQGGVQMWVQTVPRRVIRNGGGKPCGKAHVPGQLRCVPTARRAICTPWRAVLNQRLHREERSRIVPLRDYDSSHEAGRVPNAHRAAPSADAGVPWRPGMRRGRRIERQHLRPRGWPRVPHRWCSLSGGSACDRRGRELRAGAVRA